MRRRFWLAASSAAILAPSRADTQASLAAAARGLCVFLCSRGWVSLRGDGRQYVGEVVDLVWPADGDGDNKLSVAVETTAEYEARALEQVPSGGANPLRGRQDADAVEEAQRQRRDAVGYVSTGLGASQIHHDAAQAMRWRFNASGFLTASQFRGAYGVAADATMQPGQLVYATSDGTVTTTPSQHLPVAGTLVSVGASGNCVVALDGGGTVTMQVDVTATAQSVVEAVNASPARAFLQAGLAMGRGLVEGINSAARIAEGFVSNTIRAGRSRDEAMTEWRNVLDESTASTQSVEEVAASRQRQRQIGVAGTATPINGHSVEFPTSLSYRDEVDVAEARGTSPYPMGVTRGTYSATGTMTVTTEGANRFRQALLEAGVGDTAAEQRFINEAGATMPHPVVFPVAEANPDSYTTHICRRVEEIAREASATLLGEAVAVDPRSGRITDQAARRIEDAVTMALRRHFEGDIRLVVDRSSGSDGNLQTSFVGTIEGEGVEAVGAYAAWTLRGHRADLLIIDDFVDEQPSPERQEQIRQVYDELSSSRLHGDVRGVAPAIGTVHLTNTSSETYTIAPGVLAVSSTAGAEAMWGNSDTIVLPPGSVDVSPGCDMLWTDVTTSLSHIVRPCLPGVVVSQPAAAQRTYIVDAVEVSPELASSTWLARLMPRLGSEVAANDADLSSLAGEVDAHLTRKLVYDCERRALRVVTYDDWLRSDSGVTAWSTIVGRAAAL